MAGAEGTVDAADVPATRNTERGASDNLGAALIAREESKAYSVYLEYRCVCSRPGSGTRRRLQHRAGLARSSDRTAGWAWSLDLGQGGSWCSGNPSERCWLASECATVSCGVWPGHLSFFNGTDQRQGYLEPDLMAIQADLPWCRGKAPLRSYGRPRHKQGTEYREFSGNAFPCQRQQAPGIAGLTQRCGPCGCSGRGRVDVL